MTSIRWFGVVAAICAATISIAAAAATEKVIYEFPDGMPNGPILLSDSGMLYATTIKGGRTGSGLVFQISEKRGVWRGKQILDFNNDNGAVPFAGLIEDPATGTLYGTASYGGTYNYGVVYALTHGENGWTQTILHVFAEDYGGSLPMATLLRDEASGLLYGVTTNGGRLGCGVAFSLNPTTLAYRVLHSFGDEPDGCTPYVQLRPGPKPGTLFGITYSGGASGAGTVFQLTVSSTVFREAVIYSFGNGDDGGRPADIAVGNDGKIYGVAQTGGAQSNGTAFQLTPGRKWKFQVLYAFAEGAGGYFPSGITLDGRTGALYGVATYGGQFGHGALFKLSFDGTAWMETVPHSFTAGADGQYPVSRPALDANTGQLYGVTPYGGRNLAGAAYVVTP
jgi:uncharacterized repeat protein (TIGR03803 family)